ncbi:MAG: disulfide bond formation protein B [Xanthomonadales bacterium]|nr:disulfide bond formation protein B [Gammaproteobacteria bacterium]MBT8054960.1 disulfide bond formation protein B [Gammaproteobacteria bacterium]NND56342.1 disulfide bond formation protein B [Xanthomonadales bacterium]NNK52882.1 disulfide bond formation protein B [Xanthomonadales bacterium]
MAVLFQPRVWFFIVAVVCAGMVSYALYVQHVDFLEPCPLCVFQRIAFIWIGAVALLAAIHNPGAVGRWVYGGLLGIGGLAGTAIAGRHLWLQSLPPDQVPDCGMGLNYMLETLPFTQVLSEVFYGSGECAEVDWALFGISMPGWTLLWYAGITIVTIFVLISARKTKA